MKTTRREFIKGTLGGLCAAGLPSQSVWASNEAVPRRPLGKTGESISILGIGGHHLGQIENEQEAIRFVREAIDNGVTFMDNAWEYHKGRSEELMGKALQEGYRKKAFLMTKHHGRDKKTAIKHLEDSLRRLKVEQIDLWQFHEIIYEDDPKMIFSKNGGIEAAEQARRDGKIRFIGFTGHKDPSLFTQMLKQDYEWDAVQMPVNVLDPHFRSFQKEILPVLVERKIGIIAMKTLAGGHLLAPKIVTPQEALTYTWSQPVSTIVSGMDSRELLMANIQTAREFTPMSQEAQAKLLERTRSVASSGEYEPFKTTRKFDGWVGREQHGIAKESSCGMHSECLRFLTRGTQVMMPSCNWPRSDSSREDSGLSSTRKHLRN
jgi:predicted aldo/keto reductase-like oxidoreductase